MKAMRLAAAAALVALSCGTAAAQSQLRIGLAEDPDVLDPTLARTYVGRIVFASICDKFGLKPVCAGPYKFVERVQQDRIVVEKFADYWEKGRLHIDRITYLPIVDSTVRLANLRSGGLDLLERLNATDMAAVKADSKLKLNELPDTSSS